MLHARWIQFEQFRQVTILAFCALCLLLLSACGSASATTQPTTARLVSAWVGKVEDTDAFIALVSNGTELTAYVCGGPVSQWFHGQAGVDQLDLVAGTVDLSAGSGAKLQAQLTQETASGSVTLADGQTYAFQATQATGDAGLYRSEETVDNEKSVGGWVVLNDGQLRGYVEQDNLITNKKTLLRQTAISDLAKLISPTIP